MYIFGGLQPDGSVSDKLFILAAVKANSKSDILKLEWLSQDKIDCRIKGRAP